MTAYSIACLAGDGIGPEVMAQASRGMTGGGAPPRLRARRGARSVRRGRDDAGRTAVPARIAERGARRGRDSRRDDRPDAPSTRWRRSSTCVPRVMRVRLRGRCDHLRRAAPRRRVGLDARARGRDGTLEPRPPHVRRRARTAGPRRQPRPRRGTTAWTSRSCPRAARSARSRRAPESFDVIVCAPPLLVPLAELALVPRLRGACSPGAGSPRGARASSGRTTEPPWTSPARVSPIRARCCSRRR